MKNWECLVGVVHVCASDGFSGKIFGHATMTKKKPCNIWRSIQVYGYIFHLQGLCILDFSNILKFPLVFLEIAFSAI